MVEQFYCLKFEIINIFKDYRNFFIHFFIFPYFFGLQFLNSYDYIEICKVKSVFLFNFPCHCLSLRHLLPAPMVRINLVVNRILNRHHFQHNTECMNANMDPKPIDVDYRKYRVNNGHEIWRHSYVWHTGQNPMNDVYRLVSVSWWSVP